MKITKLIALPLCIALIFAMLAGCGGGNSDEESSVSAADATEEGAAAEEKESVAEAVTKDTLVVGAYAETPGLDPLNNSGNVQYMFGLCVYENLFTTDIDGNLTPGLATDWVFNDDGTELTIHLQEGVKFHNGNDFTSEDVLYTVERIATNVMWSGMLTALDLEACYAPDDYTVVLVQDHYDARLVPTLCAEVGFMMDKDYCEEVGDEGIAQAPMGTGPYSFVKNESGVGIYLERFDDYWGEPGVFKNIEIRYFTDDNTRALELERGTLDIAVIETDLNYKNIADGLVDGVYMYSWPTTKLGTLLLGTATDDTLFQNEKLRLAICHAIDVDTIVSTICGNTAIAATSSMPSNSELYSEHVYEYDPELAKELLAEAGYPDGVTFTCSVSQDQANDLRLAEAIQAQLAEVGITMEIESGDMNSVVMGQVFGSSNCSFLTNGFNGDPYEEYKPMLPDSGMKCATYTDEDALAALDVILTSQDKELRAEKFQELQDIVYEKGLHLPLYQWVAIFAAQDYVHGLEEASFHGMPIIDLTKITIS